MLNPIYLDYLLALAFTSDDVETLNNTQQTEKQVKAIENKFLTAWREYDGYSDERDDILLPYSEKQDITVTPNEYSNIFAFNRCLRHLYENDVKVFKDIGIYAALLEWSEDNEYYIGNRMIYPINKVFESSDKYKIYICVKEHVLGKDAIPNQNNTLQYYESLFYDKLPNNIVWVEDTPYMNSFLVDTQGLSLTEFCKKPIKELSTFKYVSTIDDSNIVPSDFTVNSIQTNSQFRKVYNEKLNMAWPSNRPTAYTDFSVSSCLSNSKVPASLYYLEPSEEVTTYKLIDGNDYIVSSVINDYTIPENNVNGKRWLRQWKSGWIEQGGIFTQTFLSKFDIDNIQSLQLQPTKFIGNDTYLIGIHPTANFLCKAQINPILSFTDDVELFSINANLQDVIWENTIDQNKSTNEYIYSVINNNQIVLNKAEVFSTENLNTHYTNATFYFTGTCYNTAQSNEDANKLWPANDCKTTATISWEMQGILINV